MLLHAAVFIEREGEGEIEGVGERESIRWKLVLALLQCHLCGSMLMATVPALRPAAVSRGDSLEAETVSETTLSLAQHLYLHGKSPCHLSDTLYAAKTTVISVMKKTPKFALKPTGNSCSRHYTNHTGKCLYTLLPLPRYIVVNCMVAKIASAYKASSPPPQQVVWLVCCRP